MGKIRSNMTIVDKIKDSEANVAMSLTHHHIHNGEAYTAFAKFTIPTVSTQTLTIITADNAIHHDSLTVHPSADKLQIDFYEDSVVNIEGTTLVATNRNRISPSTSGIIVRTGDTFTNNGVKLDGLSYYLAGSTGVGQTRISQNGNFGDEVILKPNTVYHYLITNGSADSNIVGIRLKWYEF